MKPECAHVENIRTFRGNTNMIPHPVDHWRNGVLAGHRVESFSTFYAPYALYAFSRIGIFGGYVEANTTKDGTRAASEPQRSSARSARLGKRLDPDLKPWLDNVVIPALVREYMAEIEKQNRLATTGCSEVASE